MTETQQSEIYGRLKPFLRLNDQWSDLILGGSMALIIQNKLPYRNTGDIDLVGHRYNHWDKQVIHHIGSSIDDSECIMIEIDGVRFDFFIKPTVLYTVVDLLGVQIKVQHPPQIIEAKMRYYTKYKITKHRDDIVAYFDIDKNGYKETDTPIVAPASSIDDDLPF